MLAPHNPQILPVQYMRWLCAIRCTRCQYIAQPPPVLRADIGRCNQTCGGGFFSQLCFVGEWQPPVLRGASRGFSKGQVVRAAVRGGRSRCNQTGGLWYEVHLYFVREWQPPVLRVEHPRPVLRADRSEHSRRHSNLGPRLRQAFGNVGGGLSSCVRDRKR